jgi:hypothetical protein
MDINLDIHICYECKSTLEKCIAICLIDGIYEFNLIEDIDNDFVVSFCSYDCIAKFFNEYVDDVKPSIDIGQTATHLVADPDNLNVGTIQPYYGVPTTITEETAIVGINLDEIINNINAGVDTTTVTVMHPLAYCKTASALELETGSKGDMATRLSKSGEVWQDLLKQIAIQTGLAFETMTGEYDVEGHGEYTIKWARCNNGKIEVQVFYTEQGLTIFTVNKDGVEKTYEFSYTDFTSMGDLITLVSDVITEVTGKIYETIKGF